MNVLVCTVFKLPHVGGASTHIELLIKTLKGRGVHVSLISGNDLSWSWCSRFSYVVRRSYSKDRARVHRLDCLVEKMAELIRTAIKRSPIESVIHCHDPLATCAALRAVSGNMPIFQTVHGPWSKENGADSAESFSAFNDAIRDLEHESYSQADMLIAVDRGQAEILRHDFNVEEQRLKIIENAVDGESLGGLPVRSSMLGLPAQYFLVPRRLVPKNGVEFALRAFSILKNKGVCLLIAGDGLLGDSLKLLSSTLEISNRVYFLGDIQRDDLIPIMKQSVAVIVPSVPVNGVVEATSLAVLEAMACGVPVIGSSIGGIRDIIVDERYGLLVEAGNSDDIADAMSRVLAMGHEKRHHLIENAQQRISERFDVKNWIASIIDTYGYVLMHRRDGNK